MALRSGYLMLCKVSVTRVNWMKLSTLNITRLTTVTYRQGSVFYSSNSGDSNSNTAGSEKEEKKKANRIKYTRWAGNALLSVGVVASIPVAVGALGFGAGGVVAGSVAASMQSAAAGTVLTGGIGVLQSVGAAGLTFSQGTLATIGVSAGLNKMSKVLSRRKKQKCNGASSGGKAKDNHASENTSKKNDTSV